MRIFILSNIKLYREGLALSLSQRPELEVIGDAALSADVLARVAGVDPAAVLLDLTAPGALDLSRGLSRSGIKVIAFGVSDIDDELITCAEAGVTGIVTKEASVDDLVASIWNAQRGEVTCSPRITGLLFKRLAALSNGAAPHGKWVLTRRQREVMELVNQGLSNKEIARTLRIGAATVKNHVHNILEKLQVRRRGEAAARFSQCPKGLPGGQSSGRTGVELCRE